MSIQAKVDEIWNGLDDGEKAWLREVHQANKEGRVPHSREIRGNLWDVLPSGFDPDGIDDRLLRKPTVLTLLGHVAVDSGGELLQDVDTILSAIRDRLRDEPQRQDVAAEELTVDTNLNVERIQLLLEHVYLELGLATGSSGGFKGQLGYESIGIDSDGVLEAYRTYDGIERVLEERYFSEGQGKQSRLPVGGDQKQEQHAIRPIFNSHVAYVDQTMCFVLMPFSEGWSDNIYDVIGKIVDDEGFNAVRADESHGSFIMEDIWTKINQAAFIIADVTEQNPNVMYELGIAHTVGKPVVMISQDVSSAPFDFQHRRIIEYSGPAGSERLREELPPAIEAALREYEQKKQDGYGVPVAVPESMVYYPIRRVRQEDMFGSGGYTPTQ